MKSLNLDFINKIKGYKLLKEVFDENNLLRYDYQSPYQYFHNFWEIYRLYTIKYEKDKNKLINNSNNGKAFEIILTYLITRENIIIKSMDQDFGIPFIKPDFVLQKKDGKLVFLSLKTSLRERWKQADWEAIRFKREFPNSYCFLLSRKVSEVINLKKKIPLLELDDVFSTDKENLERLFYLLKE